MPGPDPFERGAVPTPGALDQRARGQGTGRDGGREPGVASAGGGAQRGGGLAGAALSLQVPPPHLVPPPDHYAIHVDTFGAAFNALNTPAVIPGSLFVLPPNMVGVIRAVSLNINNLTAAIAPTWSLRFNGGSVPGWAPLTMFPRAAATISVAYGPDETFIRVPEETQVDFLFTVGPADPNTYQAGVTYAGWYFDTRYWDLFARAYSPGA